MWKVFLPLRKVFFPDVILGDNHIFLTTTHGEFKILTYEEYNKLRTTTKSS